MERGFDYESAKRLCLSHKQILESIQRIITSRVMDEDRVKKIAKEVYESKVIASQIETAFQTGNTNVMMQPNEKTLLKELYVCEEGKKIINDLQWREQQRREIIRDVNTLTSTASALKWFFAGKQTKQEANEAYQRLSQIMTKDYPTVIKNLEEKSKRLDEISVNAAYGIVSGHEKDYSQCLLRCVPDLMDRTNLPPEVSRKVSQASELIRQYESAQREQQNRSSDTVRAAKNAGRGEIPGLCCS